MPRGKLGSTVDVRLPFDLVELRTVDSTNSLARRWLERRAEEGDTLVPVSEVLFWSQEQTAGRGRQGRDWVSPPASGIYLTLVRELEDPSHLDRLPVSVAVGLAESLRRLGAPVGIKWPNDLLAAGRKLGGILIETVGSARRRSVAIIGFGINHSHTVSQLPTADAISLRQLLDPLPAIEEVVLGLVRGVRAELSALADREATVRRYAELSVHRRGDPIRCRVGDRDISGRFDGFDSHGFLCLESNGVVRRVNSGEIIGGRERN